MQCWQARGYRNQRQLLEDLASNPQLSGVQTARVQELITGKTAPAPVAIERPQEATPETGVQRYGTPADNSAQQAPAQTTEQQGTVSEVATLSAEPQTVADPEVETVVTTFLTEHASEIAAEADKPFQPIGDIHEEVAAAEPQAAAAAATAGQAAVAAKPAIAETDLQRNRSHPEDTRGSVLQKIAKLDVKGRIQLAMKGSKEERAILVRDGYRKIVTLAVADSP